MIDFGLVSEYALGTAGCTGRAFNGCLLYSAPEILEQYVRPRPEYVWSPGTDIYSLGCMLWELVCADCIDACIPEKVDEVAWWIDVVVYGHTMPWNSWRRAPKNVDMSIYNELEKIQARMCARDPSARPSSSEAKDTLRSISRRLIQA